MFVAYFLSGGTAFSNIKGRLFPMLGIGGINVHTKANFGAEEFRFRGMDSMVAGLDEEPSQPDSHSGTIGSITEDTTE